MRVQVEELFHPLSTHLNGLCWFSVEMAKQLELDVFGDQVTRESMKHYKNLAYPHSLCICSGNTPASQAGVGKMSGLGMMKNSVAVVDALAADPAKQAAYVQMVQTVWAPKHMAVADIVRVKRHLVENSNQLWQMMGAMLKAVGTGDKGSVGIAAAMLNSAAMLLSLFKI